MTEFEIISATTDGETLFLTAEGCIELGMRNDENGNPIPIIQCRGVNISILIADLPAQNKMAYIRSQIETAYAALPDLTLVKQLIGKSWET